MSVDGGWGGARRPRPPGAYPQKFHGRMTIAGQVSFDLIQAETEDDSDFEGCFRLGDSDWQIFYVSRSINDSTCEDAPQICSDAIWPNGVPGIQVLWPADRPLNRQIVKTILSDALGGNVVWQEVHGPDSLQMK